MKFKEIIQKWVIKNLKYKIMALVFAFVLWLVIVNIQDPEKTRTFSGIPVETLNEDSISTSDYVYSIASGETATVVVTGRKSIVDNLSTDDFYATADFRELSITNAIPIKVTLTGSMAMYSSQLQITQQTTSMVLTLDDIATKTVPVTIRYAGKLSDDMMVDEAVIEPAQIEITAPTQTLETITTVEVTINADDVSDKVTLRAAPLVLNYAGESVEIGDRVKISTDEVNVTFAVSKIKSVELKASTSGTPADGYEVNTVRCSFNTVKLKGSEELLESIEYIRIPATVLSVADADDDISVTVDISQYLPEGVEIYDSNVNVVITAVIEKVTEETDSEETTQESTGGEDAGDDAGTY